MAQKDALDRFYTQDDVVDACLAYLTEEMGVEYDRFVTIIEPSAGSGAFSSKFPSRRLAYDICPADGTDGIERRDWLSVTRNEVFPHPQAGMGDRSGCSQGEALVVGNPPFGLRSSIAKRFVVHAIEVGATTIFSSGHVATASCPAWI